MNPRLGGGCGHGSFRTPPRFETQSNSRARRCVSASGHSSSGGLSSGISARASWRRPRLSNRSATSRLVRSDVIFSRSRIRDSWARIRAELLCPLFRGEGRLQPFQHLDIDRPAGGFSFRQQAQPQNSRNSKAGLSRNPFNCHRFPRLRVAGTGCASNSPNTRSVPRQGNI